MSEKFYLTTAIAYASKKPHFGNTYEAIMTDAVARYRKARGYDVFFCTGTDEHGQKIEDLAKDAGITPETQYLPFSVVEDGRICHDNLKKAGKDPTWLYRQLQKENISLKEVFYMTVDEDNTVTVYKKK